MTQLHRWIAAAALVSGSAFAQIPAPPPPPTAEVSFTFDRPGLDVPRYRIDLHEDGTGTFQGEQREAYEGVARPGAMPGPPSPAPTHPLSLPITLSPERTRQIFEAAHALQLFNVACASKAKNIANTGAKSLTYKGADGSGSCQYNYTEMPQVRALTTAFMGIEQTLVTGRTLEHKHKYDRLGLDDEVTNLTKSVADGLSTDVYLIAPVLRSIADDEEVLHRVRVKAQQLLSHQAE